jgi:hypothetical protein
VENRAGPVSSFVDTPALIDRFWGMARARIADDVGEAAVRLATGPEASRNDTATAVRYLLQLLAESAPGNTVEVRVPPFGAVQAIEGPRHTRGTPPNVIETDAPTWIALATGAETWAAALAAGRVAASGSRADLSEHLPILRMRE